MDTDKCLDFLLRYLIREESRYTSYELPDDREGKWRMFRSLVNVREPKAISPEFLKVQDKLLQMLITEKGVANAVNLPFIRENISIWRGDITTLKAGAIVNAANSGMLGCFVPCHACIDNAIHTFAGVQLRLECAAIMEEQGHMEPTGVAKITAAYNLHCEHILHTVGPIVRGPVTDEDKQLLAKCYHSCLTLAGEREIESVAFCCISTGEFHFPQKEAAEIAIDTVNKFLKVNGCGMMVVFNVFTERDEQIYRAIL